MENIKNTENILLSHKNSEFYGNVDGLSLQNIFYARNEKFPGCYLFSYDMRTNGYYYFDTKKMFDFLLKNIPENEIWGGNPAKFLKKIEQ